MEQIAPLILTSAVCRYAKTMPRATTHLGPIIALAQEVISEKIVSTIPHFIVK